MTGRKRFRFLFWMAGGLAVCTTFLGLYILSVGPASWLMNHEQIPPPFQPVYFQVYAPIAWLDTYGPEPIRRALDWYGVLWTFWLGPARG